VNLRADSFTLPPEVDQAVLPNRVMPSCILARAALTVGTVKFAVEGSTKSEVPPEEINVMMNAVIRPFGKIGVRVFRWQLQCGAALHSMSATEKEDITS